MKRDTYHMLLLASFCLLLGEVAKQREENAEQRARRAARYGVDEFYADWVRRHPEKGAE